MQVGQVVGRATSTIKHPTLKGERLLVVQLLDAQGNPEGEPILVFDRLGAGIGDHVVATNDGLEMQTLLGKTTPARWSVLALPDPIGSDQSRPAPAPGQSHR
ncbi:Ethanolamine utilization protein EutN/carboxysome structural protein Ccml [Isosphaera pallida ATCC 43644]|uniref:Ethanolamine utilization protein EutN/carboxysome structural protein Ccml n=1 Tax=Isosphaera pallida (strain ATCC 43644 / DSM 9630 / IS1B) TaxID=575540 RepID=E8R088_ISOPI|nr:EutN/CcmL family microcompartment protein [Isosphaera pallida]ADV62215.1 Ethanolamine utilization protein EutN/carboxysome structural protein Ccml [Isosphaera pallida ATCC 43644]